MQWSSADIDTVPCRARSLTEVNDQCLDYLNSGPPPDATFESPWQRSVLWCPTTKLLSCLKSLEELAREVALVQGQPAGKVEGSESSGESGPLPVPKSARVVSGRRHRRLRNVRSTKISNRASDVPQVGARAYAPFVRNRRKSAMPCYLHHHGSQLHAAVMDRWPSFSRSGSRNFLRFHQCLKGVPATRTCAHPTSNVGTSLGRITGQLHPSQSSPCGSVRPHLAGVVHASVRALGVEKEGYCSSACATSPTVVGRDRTFRNCRAPRWVCSRGPLLASIDHVPNAPDWSQHRSGARFRNVARSAKTRSVEGP